MEPNTFIANQGLVMAKALVDTTSKEINLSVLNLSARSVKLHNNTIVGELSPVGRVHTIEEKGG